MKASIRLFSLMVVQVSHEVGSQLGEKALSGRGRQLAAALAIGLAASTMAAPAMADCQSDAQAQQTQQAQAAAKAKGEGGLIGTVIGGLGGALLTNRAAPLTKLAAVFGGAFVGKEMGQSIAGNLNGGDGNADASTSSGMGANQPAAAVGAGARPVRTQAAVSPGSCDTPVAGTVISRRDYNTAVANTFSSVPAPPVAGKRALDGDLQVSLSASMVKVAADRDIANKAQLAADRAELARQFSPQDAAAISRAEHAQSAAQGAINTYRADAGHLFTALASAERMGFDVTAQSTLVSAMPSDLRQGDALSSNWPGVQERVASLSSRQVATLGELNGAHGDVQREAPARQRGN